MMNKWPRYLEKYTHSTSNENNNANATSKFIFKREAMITKASEMKLQDEVAIKLLYGEARTNVMNGRYPLTTIDELITMATLQAQVSYGTFVASKHQSGTGFIAQSLSNLVPKYAVVKLRTSEWEQRIAESWIQCSETLGEVPLGAHRRYLELVRSWNHYGATFFPACSTMPPSGYFELRTEHLWVTVNAEGMSIIDEDRHRVSWYAQYDALEWECTPDSITIEYTVAGTGANGQAPKRKTATLITPQSHLIDSLASRAIYNIERLERRAQRAKAAVANGGAKDKILKSASVMSKQAALSEEASSSSASGRGRSLSNAKPTPFVMASSSMSPSPPIRQVSMIQEDPNGSGLEGQLARDDGGPVADESPKASYQNQKASTLRGPPVLPMDASQLPPRKADSLRPRGNNYAELAANAAGSLSSSPVAPAALRQSQISYEEPGDGAADYLRAIREARKAQK